MYHCDDNIVNDFEDLVYDFLCYRKNKKQDVKMRQLPFCCQSLIEDVDYDCENLESLPEPMYCNMEDAKYYNFVMSELSREIDKIIDEILNEYEYEGSPIFENQIDRESLAQIVSKIIELAIDRIDELKDIKPDMKMQNFSAGPYSILKALVEALVINNIFMKRRPMRNGFNYFLPY